MASSKTLTKQTILLLLYICLLTRFYAVSETNIFLAAASFIIGAYLFKNVFISFFLVSTMFCLSFAKNKLSLRSAAVYLANSIPIFECFPFLLPNLPIQMRRSPDFQAQKKTYTT